MCDYYHNEELNVNERNELKNNRDNTDEYVHNALVKCVDNKGFVYIAKIESFNEHDILVKVGYTFFVKELLNENMTILNAFFADNLSLVKNELSSVFENNVPQYNKYGNDVYMISRHDLKEFIKDF